MWKVCVGKLNNSHLQRIPDFQNRLFTRHSGAKYRTIMCRIRHSILFHAIYHFFCQISFYCCFYSFYSSSFLFKGIKIGSHEHLQDFLPGKMPSLPLFSLLFCFYETILRCHLTPFVLLFYFFDDIKNFIHQLFQFYL